MAVMRRFVRGEAWTVDQVGEGPPLLLLHGFTGSRLSWNGIVRDLAPYFTCVTVDILGHGDSAAPDDVARYSMSAIAADLFTLMEDLGHPVFRCLGYSMGGRIALSLACTMPQCITAVVLESASPGLRKEVERQARMARDTELAERLESIGLERFVDDWQGLPLFASQQRLSPQIRTRQREIRLRHTPQGLANSLRGTGTGAQPSWWDALSGLTMPVLLITGEEDSKFASIAEEMQVAIPHAKHVRVPEAGHNVHLEQPDEYVRVVCDFLTDRNKSSVGQEG